ncbi:MAG: tRNA dihydrouridine synthase DusB [Clostridia bacterium]|nr:tRNA dihydrouridine synthase DusB [Clostridia bacterium]
MNSNSTETVQGHKADGAEPAVSFGGISLKHGLMLAPMAGVTDKSMRTVCGLCGNEYSVTEMVSAKALVFEQNSREHAPAKTADLCIISEDEPTPVAVQLFGSEPEFIAEAARLISFGAYRAFRGRRADAVDINMGCPVKKVVSCGEGSALMKDPEKIFRIVSAASKASVLPVTVKIRAGWDSESINAPECAKAAEEAGAAAVCVHARTREQFYTPGIITDVIGNVKAAVKIPVFGNGDIVSASDALIMKRETGCDGIAVARGAIGNPWIFSEIASAFENVRTPDITFRTRLETALLQLRLTVADKGEKRGVSEVKYAISYYVKGLRGAASAREKIMRAASSSEIEAVLTDFFSAATES